MSAQDHPPGCDHLRYCARCSAYVGDLATMRAAQEFTRVVCELLGDEGSGMDVSTDVLQDMLTAAGVTP